MSCPFYKDFTRECTDEFPDIVTSTDYTMCNSNKYIDCPFYKPIIEKENCKFYDKCKVEFKADNIDFNKVKQCANDYCATKTNRINCARYKLYDIGK